MPFTLATFNTNGIRARLPILSDWLGANQPDLLCLQEIKVQDKDFPLEALAELGYEACFLGQKSYNGVAILCREAPDEVIKGRPGVEDEQARVIAGRWGGLWVLNTYVPQGREPGHPAFQYKLEFLAWMRDWLERDFSPEQDLIWTGDLNVAPGDQDLWDPVKLAGQPGCQPEERQALQNVLDWGLSDLFRLHHPGEVQYTFWDYRMRGGVKRNQGWRIDHIMASQSMAGKCTDCWVDMEPRMLEKPSDHTFLLARFDLD